MLRVCCNSCFLAFQSDEDDYVECQCEHLSIFAAEGNSDNRTGYELYFRIVCFVCMVSGLLCEFVLCILGFIINPSLSPPGHLIYFKLVWGRVLRGGGGGGWGLDTHREGGLIQFAEMGRYVAFSKNKKTLHKELGTK